MTTRVLTTTRRARKRPAESRCQPAPSLGKESLAPRPRALNRPLLFPAELPIRLGLPPALRIAASTCFTKGRKRMSAGPARLRARPRWIRKSSGESRAIPKRFAGWFRRRKQPRERIAALRTETCAGAETTVRPKLQLASGAGLQVGIERRSSSGGTTRTSQSASLVPSLACETQCADRHLAAMSRTERPRTSVRFILPS